MGKYPPKKEKLTKLAEAANVYGLIHLADAGIRFADFNRIALDSPFSMQEWSDFLHITERTFQRYKREKGVFGPLQSERILRIILLNQLGEKVFGNREKYAAWLESENVALGNAPPKSILHSAFGLDLLTEELNRIQFGILA